MLPHLRTLDFNRITQKVLSNVRFKYIYIDFCFQEREAARKIYKSKSSEKAKKKQKSVNTFVPGGELAKQQQMPRMTKKDADAIKVCLVCCSNNYRCIYGFIESDFGS